MTTDSSVQVSVASLVSAARALIRACRFAEAADVLGDAGGDHPAIAVARAEFAVTRDWYQQTHLAHSALDAARPLVAGDPQAAWDLEFLTVRYTYGRHFHGDVGGDDVDDLRQQAESVSERAPDDRRHGWAEMYRGLIADNVLEERTLAPPHYQNALRAAEKTGDDLLTFEALRHLGDHAHDAGDATLAREHWERSTESAAIAGSVIGVLAQQILLAQLAREAGDEAGAAMVAREVSRWTGALGAHRHKATADGFLTGMDPTKRPADDETR